LVFDESVRAAAENRLRTTIEQLRAVGIEASGEVLDPDPFNATMDALGMFAADEIVVSTYPATTSGWLRRDLVERIQDAVGDRPVHHVVSDIDAEGLPFGVTLVVANRTASSPELLQALKERAEADERGRHLFIAVVPQEGTDGNAAQAARGRLQALISSLDEHGIVAAGMIGDPDPYTATMNAVHYFHLSQIVISTLPHDTSKWMADKLVERVSSAANLPVEHIESRAPEPAEA
jgi:hypothetical protein